MERIVSISTVLFDGYSMELAIDEIAHSGARYVEPAYIRGYMDFTEDDFGIDSSRRLRGLIESAGLKAHSISAHMDLSHDNARAMLKRRIDFAGVIGARVLITNAGPVSGRQKIMSSIEAVLPQLEDWGGMLAIENPGHGTDDIVGNAVEGKSLIDAVGSEQVRLNHDAGNVFTYSREVLKPTRDFLAAVDAVGHVHLKDVKVYGNDWQFCAIGCGDVELAEYIAAIPKMLPLTLELPLRLYRPGRSNPRRASAPREISELREALEKSLAFVRSVEALADCPR